MSGGNLEQSHDPKDLLIGLIADAVPERANEFADLWSRYDPELQIVNSVRGITLDATKDRIRFDVKTMEVFWLIGFSGWRAIECYSPHVVLSCLRGKPIETLIASDTELPSFERDYKERIAACQTLIDVANAAQTVWPPDLPRPGADRQAFADDQYKTAYDLTWSAIAFTILHEFHHVMLDKDDQRPSDRREEELFCDVWARQFMTERLEIYASKNGHDYLSVLLRRLMGLALASLILHEVTPFWVLGGNSDYFSIGERLTAILDNAALPEDSHFWVFVASLLIGVYRQRNDKVNFAPTDAKELARHLIAGL